MSEFLNKVTSAHRRQSLIGLSLTTMMALILSAVGERGGVRCIEKLKF